MNAMFYRRSTISSEITIESINLDKYENMLTNCSTAKGSKFTLKFISETKTLVETKKEAYKDNPNIVIEPEVQLILYKIRNRSLSKTDVVRFFFYAVKYSILLYSLLSNFRYQDFSLRMYEFIDYYTF